MADSHWISADMANDLARSPPSEILPGFVDWLWDTPASLIPSNQQAEQARSILLARSDREACAQLVAEIDDFLST